ncbi:hypothetical protein [Goodfellowiella coeruleoviolacea]|uniref:Uncharacterized protein n=1 Tax=Goodfellowiella coeruleoviolacea TaxID=334858 RepID=A0AAE3KF47_9PSEU|nr:hypothetical protein [Goodfellowiella coeruleoviolacea]MCP2164572.1 hypothetical protein [Goodfellowiella coeruleoviolacea]
MEHDDLARRVTLLEEQMRQVRHDLREAVVTKSDVAAARTLASGAHEDVADVRDRLIAHTKTLNALRETQVEHGQTLAEHGKRLTSLETKLDALETKVDNGFATLGAGMTQITALLTTLVERDQPKRD